MKQTIQMEVVNGTVFPRRIFLLGAAANINEPVPTALNTWKSFELKPGESVGTVDGAFQIGVQVSRIVHGVTHQTAFTEASVGETWQVELRNGAPVLSRTATGGASLNVVNGLSGAEAAVIEVTLYRDYAPLFRREVAAGAETSFAAQTGFHCYASMPIESDEQPLVLETVAGYVDLRDASNVRLMVAPNGSAIQWTVNGNPA